MIKKIIKWGLLLLLIAIIIVLGIDFFVKVKTRKLIVDVNSDGLSNMDCALVLGAGVWGDEPSPMLRDRLDVAIKLYNDKKVSKIIMSGDHTRNNYDEVNIMKSYAINKGVASSDIFMDHAGISTYDSVYRAKYIFKLDKVIIVTQKYHLYRSLYIAEKLGLEAVGVEATPIKYGGQFLRDIREILARDKDFVKCIFRLKSKIGGETIQVNGNGDVTNDKEES